MKLGSLFILFFMFLFLCVPIGFSLGIVCLIAKAIYPNLPANAEFVFRHMVSAVDTYPIVAVPLFILSGIIMARGGVSRKIFDVFAFFFGRMTGGLPAAVTVTCLFYGAISGSAPATTAAVGAMTIPILVNLGYDKVFVTSLVATAGSLGIIIPPSIPFIMYGLSASQSVGALFIAGIIPGILVGLCIIFVSFLYCKFKGEDKEKLRENSLALRQRGFLNIIRDSFWALLTPVIILGGIYGGIVTPTEAANISVVYSLIISIFIYKTLTVKDLPGILRDAVKTTAPILIIISTATVFGRVLTLLQAPQLIAEFLTSAFQTKFMILLVINIFLIFVGMIMDTTAAILILTPIFLPIISKFGINPIHFGVIMIVNLAIAFVTPPVGLNLYVASTISNIPIMKIATKAIPFIGAFIIALLVITYIPAISLVLLN